MIDYDKLSTEDLIALQNGEYDKVSTETLQALRNAEIERSAKTIDEMHPALGRMDRAIVKNFASNPESAIGYLQKEHPDLIFRNVGGEIQVRGKDETDYRKLDPSSFEPINDTTDVITDVGQGIAEAAAMAKAAVLAGIPTLGTASIPAALAARAGVGAIGETVKQGIGSAVGIPDNFDGKNIAISSAANALMPVIGKGIAKGYNATKNTVLPNVASFVSGIDKDVIKNINLDEQARDYIRSVGNNQYLKKLSQDIGVNINSELNSRGQALDALTAPQINLAPVRDNIANTINGRTGNLIQHEKDDAAKLLGLFKGLDGQDVFLSPEQARRMRDSMNTIASSADSMPSTKGIARDARTAIKDTFTTTSPNPVAHRQASQAYHEVADELEENAILRSFVSKKGTNNEAANLQSLIDKNYAQYGLDQSTAQLKADQAMDFISKYGGVDPKKIAREVTSANVFNDPKIMPSGWLANAKGAGIGSALGAGVGYLSGGGVAAGIPLTIGGGMIGEAMASPWAIKQAATKGKMVEGVVDGGVNWLNNKSPYILRSTPKAMYNMWDSREDRN